ncbi:MAG: hypothetical protein V7642_5257 [Burkholderiales bacterium]
MVVGLGIGDKNCCRSPPWKGPRMLERESAAVSKSLI